MITTDELAERCCWCHEMKRCKRVTRNGPLCFACDGAGAYAEELPGNDPHERFLALCDELLKRGALVVQDGALSATFAPPAQPVVDLATVYERLNTVPAPRNEEEEAEREAAELIP